MALFPYSLDLKVILDGTTKLQFFARTSLSPIFRLDSFPATQSGHSSFKPNILGFHKGFCCRATMAGFSSSSSLSGQAKDEISLTDKENQIFERLLQVLHHFNLQTQLRVAGGWVRDKLLRKDCSNIDIALDNMMGKEFCEKVNEYLSFAGEEIQGIAVIQCNPDQSKHLETARMKLFGEWIDFEFGSTEKDAYRRDLTFNSLFYNINKKSVEDLTGRGLSDLRSGKIVTPLPPKETFFDDPLCVLRAIRFGARFCFELDEELKEAAGSDEVRAALADKISREHTGHEIDLMISGKHPVQAMTYICSLQLFWVVFPLPSKFEPAVLEGCDDKLCISSMDAAWNLLDFIGCTGFTDEQRRLYLYSTLFHPLREVVYRDNKGKKIPVANYIFLNSLKLKVSDSKMVISLHSASERFISLIPSLTEIKTAEAGNRREKLDVTSKLRICAGLENVWEMKPLVNGREIMTILQLKTGGPLVSEWQRKALEWQLADPNRTSEECLDWMRETFVGREMDDLQVIQNVQSWGDCSTCLRSQFLTLMNTMSG
ncbi:hypothetical protein MKX01_013931 [Papaver californicum]|nr:hypothetical protein MKX01_013931 [Papaver californicum]